MGKKILWKVKKKKETIEKVKRREALVKHSVHCTSTLLRYHFLITYFSLLGQNIFYILDKTSFILVLTKWFIKCYLYIKKNK